MSGNPPRLPPGISLQRAAPDPPPPRLPPGISLQRSSDAQLNNLPSGIQVQRSSSSKSSTSSGLNKLAGLGIQISRSEEESPPPPANNAAMDRLSGLGVSVSGGPRAAQPPARQAPPRLPPGVSISGGPDSSQAPPPRLPPGISISGGSGSSNVATARAAQPAAVVPRLPPGINISGGGTAPAATRAAPPQRMSQNGPSPQQQQQQHAAAPPRPRRPSMEAAQFTQPQSQAHGLSSGRGRGRPRKPSSSSAGSSGPSPNRSPAQTPPPPSQSPKPSPMNHPPGTAPQPKYHPVPSPGNYQASPSPVNFQPSPSPVHSSSPSPVNPQHSPLPETPIPASKATVLADSSVEARKPHPANSPQQSQGLLPRQSQAHPPQKSQGLTPNQQSQGPPSDQSQEITPQPSKALPPGPGGINDVQQDPEVPDSASQSSASPDQSIGQATTDKTEASVADPAKDSQQNIQGQQSLNTEDNGEEEGVLPTDQQGEEQQMEAEESTEQESMDTSESPETEAAGGEAQSHPPTLPPENGLDQPGSADSVNAPQPPQDGSDPATAAKDSDNAASTANEGDKTVADKQPEDGETVATEEGEYLEDGEYYEDYEYGYEGYEGYEDGTWEGCEEGGWEEEWTEEGETAAAPPADTVDATASSSASKETDKDGESSKDSDGAPKVGEAPPAPTGEGSGPGDGEVSGSQATTDNGAPKEQAQLPKEQAALEKIAMNGDQEEEEDEDEEELMDDAEPPGLTVKPAGSSTPLPNLPPGISISNNSGAPALPPGITMSRESPAKLPPGISISPFKKPSVRASVDDDSRSQHSNDRDGSMDRSSDMSDARSTGLDRTPRVGPETTCVFCHIRCSDRKPKLLSCLHSACSNCFYDQLAEARREDNCADVVDLDGDGIMAAPEVTCPICRSTTSEEDVIDNLFIQGGDSDPDDGADEDAQYCNSCDDNQMASSKCIDCDEFLCTDCCRAHQRVKQTKFHKIMQVKSSLQLSSPYKMCSVHPNERLSLYCESCDILNCRDCQLSERHRHCKYRYSYEVAPDVKGNLVQSSSDIRMKKSHIEESVGILSTKIAEVNIKERSLLTQLNEVKNFIINKVEDRYRELSTEVTKRTREKRKKLEGRKQNLDRSLWQADYALTFIDHIVNGNVEDEKLLLSKRLVMRQLKRLKRVNQAVNLPPSEMEFKLDLYFQHFHGQNLHSNVDSVVKMILGDIKVSSIPIEPPKPKAPPPPPQQNAPRPAPNPVTPTRGLPQSPQAMGRGSPRQNMGNAVRQLATPTKSPARTQMKTMSPGRTMMPAGGMGRGVPQQRVQVMAGGRGQVNAVRGARGRQMQGGMGNQMMRGGAQQMRAGQSQMRGRAIQGGGLVVGTKPMRGRGQLMPTGGRGSGGMMRGHAAAQPHHQQMRGTPRMRQQPIQGQGRRGRPAGGGQNMMLAQPRYATQNQQYTNAALGLSTPAIGYSPQPKPKPPRQRVIQAPQQQQFNNQQQQFNQVPPQRQPKQQSGGMAQLTHVPAGVTLQSVNSNIQDSDGASWHTPSIANRPVSPPTMKDSNFKIIIPKMGPQSQQPGGPATLKRESTPDVIDLDATMSKLPAHLNISRTGGGGGSHSGGGNRPSAAALAAAPVTVINTSKPGLTISKMEEGVDPLSDEQDPLRIEPSDRNSVVTAISGGSSGSRSSPAVAAAPAPMVSLNIGAVKAEAGAPNIKIEQNKTIQRMDNHKAPKAAPAPRAPQMEPSALKEREDGDWCAVCHDGGDTLYCCDRCPKVYHLYCYIPALENEPPDDWCCIMCETREGIFSLSTKVKKGRGLLSERDLKLCRRLLLEMYNLWPESVPFRDCADLNFKQYLDKIKEPIALDVIKQRLSEDSPQQYSSVMLFLADLRKMFRNCFTFNQKDSEIYKHAKKMEEKLDALLEVWVPEFARDPLFNVGVATKRPASPKAGPSKKKRATAVDEVPEKKKRGRKKKRRNSDFESSDSGDSDMSEGERERQQYLAAMSASIQDHDPTDVDFVPDEDDMPSKGKGKGRGKGRR